MSFLAGISIAMQGASLITSMLGNRLETASNIAAANERADSDIFNAKVAEGQAQSELEGSQGDAADFRRAQSARLAASRAVGAASGFTLEGSPLLVDASAVSDIEFGVSRIIHEGQTRAAALRQEGTLLTRSAAVEKQNAQREKSAGVIKQFGTLTSGIAGIAASASQFKKQSTANTTLTSAQPQFG